MLQLFYIHSHTTYLSVLGIIAELKLIPENVIFITTRRYLVKDYIPAKVLDLSSEFTYLMDEKYSFYNIKKTVNRIDDLIKKEIKSPYKAFLPHIGVYLMQLIATHKLCVEVSFIEEGHVSYSRRMQSDDYSLKNGIKSIISRLLIPSKRFWLTDFIYDDFYRQFKIGDTYGISKKTFEYLPYHKKIIKWPRLESYSEINKSYPIYIFDALIEMNFIPPAIYFEAIKKMIGSTAGKINYIKFHPYQKAESINFIKKQFKLQDLKYIELRRILMLKT